MPYYWLRDQYLCNIIHNELTSNFLKTKLIVSCLRKAEDKDINDIFNNYLKFTLPWTESKKMSNADLAQMYKKRIAKRKKGKNKK